MRNQTDNELQSEMTGAVEGRAVSDWRMLVDYVESIPEQVYEHNYDNHTPFGVEFGLDGEPWCVEFAWDMYHDVNLDKIVPKTASVLEFVSWAKQRGQWSEYPSIGAWIYLKTADGQHTEIVVGFDADKVYTKGGNSHPEGATDSGHGNGVWSHSTPRRASYVVGYFAPRFQDGQCPPTADPHDPRGGHAVTAWRWSAPATPSQPFPGVSFFVSGKKSPIIAAMHERLIEVGCDRYQSTSTTDRDVWGSGDIASYSAWQHMIGYRGQDENGIPGSASWIRLRVPKVV